ncbi:hypothetical protein BJ508DRAFT_371584 [Ascobolus immersus RN42]|uniref:Uncharacterized protein n=1 Tax=Ascobolus immersus RN42 TaxID=1160509 RepID=A0A3N4IQQ8_ASCIM|nr:hypothetical protein BJ508DRAFT_371584 [Ascobolus immersus RN42]
MRGAVALSILVLCFVPAVAVKSTVKPVRWLRLNTFKLSTHLGIYTIDDLKAEFAALSKSLSQNRTKLSSRRRMRHCFAGSSAQPLQPLYRRIERIKDKRHIVVAALRRKGLQIEGSEYQLSSKSGLTRSELEDDLRRMTRDMDRFMVRREEIWQEKWALAKDGKGGSEMANSEELERLARTEEKYVVQRIDKDSRQMRGIAGEIEREFGEAVRFEVLLGETGCVDLGSIAGKKVGTMVKVVCKETGSGQGQI